MFSLFKHRTPQQDPPPAEVDYELVRSHRRKTIEIQVRPGAVRVLAPAAISRARVDQFIAAKQDWINKRLVRFAQQPVACEAPVIDNGYELLYLGGRYPLQVFDQQQASSVSLEQGKVLVRLSRRIRRSREAAIHDLLEQWYRQQAEEYFRARTDHWAAIMGAKPATVSVRSYRRKWGCCNSRAELRFNWLLIMAEAKVIDYVVVHELSHLQHMDHSPQFWQRVARFCPDYNKSKRWLNQSAYQLRW